MTFMSYNLYLAQMSCLVCTKATTKKVFGVVNEINDSHLKFYATWSVLQDARVITTCLFSSKCMDLNTDLVVTSC
jgi:hypothetical protein